MCLRDGSGTERRFIKGGEQFRQRRAQFVFHRGAHFRQRHGRRFRTQFGQFLAIFARDHVRAQGEKLADFHKSGAKVFQHQAQFFRRQPPRCAALAEDGKDRLQARGVAAQTATRCHPESPARPPAHLDPIPRAAGAARRAALGSSNPHSAAAHHHPAAKP